LDWIDFVNPSVRRHKLSVEYLGYYTNE
jgi:hypothetical protein